MRQGSGGLGHTLTGAEPEARTPVRRGWRRWWRWIIGAVVALVVVAVAATGLVITLTPGPAPLALPKNVAAPSGSLAGTWRVAAGSLAGFRVRETVIGFSNDVTGRTGDVTGTVTLTSAAISRATFRVRLAAISVNGKTGQPQLVKSLRVTTHPVATISLTRPVPLPPAFSTGAVVSRTANATLTLNGVTRAVAVTLSARRDGTAIEAAGSLPVTFSAFHISGPGGFGLLGSLASHGTAEFLLILRPE
ncbi:MAG TPA: YceI family protein [Streptosporangiaceae bacterium]|nr:YceI family protein [Streptosporangiaceae bacterium]